MSLRSGSMDKDRKHMRFLAACFALMHCGNSKIAVNLADELLEELDNPKTGGGLVDIVSKRRRKPRSNP